MNKISKIAKELIDSYSLYYFSLHKTPLLDMQGNMPKAVENAILLAESQISMINRNEQIYLVKGYEIDDLDFWFSVIKELEKY